MTKPLNDSLAALCARHGVAELYAFGSRAGDTVARLRGGQAHAGPAGSDVDVGVRFTREAVAPDALERLDSLVSLSGELEGLLGLGRVDLVDAASAEPFVAADIVRGELLWCRDAADQAEFELYVLRRAGDLAWFKRREMGSILFGEAL